jgi:hypothetical protein
MHKTIRMTSLLLAIFFVAGAVAFAQESQSKAPVVTAEDVLRVSRGSAGATAARRLSTTPAAETEAQQSLFAAAERNWNQRLKLAQQTVKDLLSRADATELEINNLKNALFSAERRSTQEHKGLITEVDDLTEEMRRLRAEAAVARVVVEQLLDEGQAKGFRVASASLTNTIGSSGPLFYRSRYNELQSDLVDTQQRADVLQTRVSTLRRTVLLNSRTGDEFYNNRVRGNMQDMIEELNETQERVTALRNKIAELRQEARGAGVVLN